MGLSHINLHGIHKILALSIFLYTYALSNMELSQACSVAERSRCGVSRVTMSCSGKTHRARGPAARSEVGMNYFWNYYICVDGSQINQI